MKEIQFARLQMEEMRIGTVSQQVADDSRLIRLLLRIKKHEKRMNGIFAVSISRDGSNGIVVLNSKSTAQRQSTRTSGH